MTIHLKNEQRSFPLNIRRIRSAIQRLMKVLHLDASELSLLLTDDAGITELNRRYLHRDRPTNVISFPMNDSSMLGDIAISVETASRNAREGEIPLEDEIIFLIIHGLLHLTGYDHEDGDESKAALMKIKERELFHLVTGYELD